MNLKEVLREQSIDFIKYTRPFSKKNEEEYEIILNPSAEELKKIKSKIEFRGIDKGIIKDKRAIIDKKGNFYTISPQGNIIHNDIIKILNAQGYLKTSYGRNWWENEKSLDDFLAISIKKDGSIAISDNYDFEIPDDKKDFYSNISKGKVFFK